MRIMSGHIEAEGVLIPEADLILIRSDLCSVHAYAIIRALLPDAPPTTVLALSEQITEPDDVIPADLARLA